MVQINFASREVNCKIVYYGPGRCGKTTNLQVVHQKAPPNSKGDLVSIATETDRTLYFDFLPLDLGTVAGMRTKFQLYTVPGQVFYDATRKLVLQGCDGVVFVADSNPDIMPENIESLDNLAKNLRENGLDIDEIPLVLQLNKRDLPNALPATDMIAKLNRGNWPSVEAVAINGDGVFQTLKAISQQVIKRLNREYGDESAKRGARPASVKAKSPAPPPPPPRLAGAPAPPAPAAAAGAARPPPRPPPPRLAGAPAPPAPAAAAGAARSPPAPAPPPPEEMARAAGAAAPIARPSEQGASQAPRTAAQAQAQGDAVSPAKPHAAAPSVPPAMDGASRSRTEVFRERMAEIKKQAAQAPAKQEKAGAGESQQGQAVGASQGTAAGPQKKGCLGMLLMAAVTLLVAGAGLAHWFG